MKVFLFLLVVLALLLCVMMVHGIIVFWCNRYKSAIRGDLIHALELAAIQEDAPVYLEDKEVDSYVRLSMIYALIDKYL